MKLSTNYNEPIFCSNINIPMPKVYFWRDLVGHDAKFLPYKAKIQQLLAGSYAGLSLEKLKIPSRTPIYSVRINKENRLLFTTYEGKLCLLDIVLNHDYHKSSFLRTRGFLNAFLDKHHEALDRAATPPWALTEREEDDFVTVKCVSGLSISSDALELAALDYYQRRLIEFSAIQNEVLSVRLPLVVSGPAGSGKSCTAVSILSNHVQRYIDEDEAFPIVYMSRSRHLVADIRRIWQEKNPMGLREGAVFFKTYDELLDEQIPEGFRRADPEIFSTWYKDYLAHSKKLSKTAKALGCVPIESTKELWREFRIISGGYSKDEYLALGEGQSGVSDKGQRELIYKSYYAYLDYLSSQHLIESELHSLKARPYKLVVVDEAQDLSYGQLLGLSRLAGHNSVFLLGEHQILFDGLSRQAYLQRLFHQQGISLNLRQLQATYRSSPAVLAVANALIQAKYRATGGAVDKGEVAELEASEKALARENQALWFDPRNKKELARIKEHARCGQIAVVAWSSESMREAQEVLGTPLVFTPAEIKGLEYPTVVVWQPLSGSECDDACEKLRGLPIAASSSAGHLPKKGHGNTASLPYFNELITAVTRAQHTLIVVQSLNNHARRPLIEVLSTAIPSLYHALNSKSPGSRTITPSSSSPSDEGIIGFAATSTGELSSKDYWESEAAKLVTQGLERQAEAIFLENLGKTKVEYEAFAEIFRPELSVKPVAYASTASALSVVESALKSEKSRHQETKGLVPTKSSAESAFSATGGAAKTPAKSKSLMSIEAMKDIEEKEKKLKDIEKTLTSAKKSILLKIHIQENVDCLSDQYVAKWMKSSLGIYDPERAEKTLFHWFFSTPSGVLLFCKICSGKYAKILENINPEAWGQGTGEGILGDGSALDFLCSTVDGLPVLKYLVINYQWIVEKIPAKAWANCTRDRVSPLCSLMATDLGIESLLVLMWNYPKTMAEIPAKAWTAAPDRGRYINVSPLHWLFTSSNADSNLIFDLIMSKHPHIPSSFWILERLPEVYQLSAFSPLFILAGKPQGREKLNVLLRKFPNIIRSIPTSAWSEAGPITSRLPNTSPIYWLTASSDSVEILRYFIEHFSDVIDKIPSSTWALATPESAELDPNASPLFWLTIDEENRKTFKLMIKHCPRVIAGIPSEAWALPALDTTDHPNVSPLIMLAQCLSGRSIIKELLETQPDVICNIPPAAWEWLPPHAGIANAIYFLISSRDGIEIIQLLKTKLSDDHPLKKMIISNETIIPGKPSIFAGSGHSINFFPQVDASASSARFMPLLTPVPEDGPR